MATVSSHILDSVSGVSAAGIRVALYELGHADKNRCIFDVDADAEGRVSESVEIIDQGSDIEYELVFHSGEYFAAQAQPNERAAVLSQTSMKTVVLRFSITDNDKRYHMPVMLAPRSYSVWSSN